jgi:hypothetical protein
MAEIEYEIREQDLLAFNDHQLKNSERVQKTMRRHQATIPAFLVLVALVALFYFQDTLAALWVGASAALWGGLVPLWLKWNTRNQIRKLYTDEVKAAVLGRFKLRTETHHLVEVTKQGESRIKWSDILRVETNKNYAFIFVTMDSALILPKATVKSGNIVDFVKEVEQRIDQAG